MTTMYRRFKRWQRLRAYRTPIDWLRCFFAGTLPLCIGLLIWGMALQLTILNVELSTTHAETQQLQRDLDDAEHMLTTCLNGGTPAFVEEGKYRVYIECPVKAKERIYENQRS